MTVPKITAKKIGIAEIIEALARSEDVETKYDDKGTVWIRRVVGTSFPSKQCCSYYRNNYEYSRKRLYGKDHYESDYGFGGGIMGYWSRDYDTLLEYDGVDPWEDVAGVIGCHLWRSILIGQKRNAQQIPNSVAAKP